MALHGALTYINSRNLIEKKKLKSYSVIFLVLSFEESRKFLQFLSCKDFWHQNHLETLALSSHFIIII